MFSLFSRSIVFKFGRKEDYMWGCTVDDNDTLKKQLCSKQNNENACILYFIFI